MEEPSFLLVADARFYRPLVAQINSILVHHPRARIHLVHDLTPEQLATITPYLAAEERFLKDRWAHMQVKPRITHTNMGKYQSEIVTTDHYLYLDTDVVLLKPVTMRSSETMCCETYSLNLAEDPTLIPLHESFQLMNAYLRPRGGITIDDPEFILYGDGIYYGNRSWVTQRLRPVIEQCSKEMPQGKRRFFGMGFFQAALRLLHEFPASNNLAVLTEHVRPADRPLSSYDLIHYCGPIKPWDYPPGEYPLSGGELWWDFYTKGRVRGE